jgi:transposase
MTKRIDYTLSDEQLKVIETLIRQDKSGAMVRRATALRLLHEGLKPQQVAAIIQVTVTTIYNWWNRWAQGGVEHLETQPIPGRPARTDDHYWQVIAQAVDSEPETLGYAFTIWTLERLRDHAERVTGVHLNAAYLSEQMKVRGYVYRRPKHDLRVHQDPQAHAEAEAYLDELKKKPTRAILSFSSWTKRP